MSGITLREAFMLIDPNLRFQVGKRVLTAGQLARAMKIPHDSGRAIYALYEDDLGRVAVGIAQSSGSGIGWRDWVNDQVTYPVYRSIDRVDVLGRMIPSKESDK